MVVVKLIHRTKSNVLVISDIPIMFGAHRTNTALGTVKKQFPPEHLCINQTVLLPLSTFSP